MCGLHALAQSVTTLRCNATKLEGQREVSGYTLVALIVAARNESLRLNIPPLGFRQSLSKQLAGRHASTADLGGGEGPNVVASPLLL
jgi:hypothetical protein